MAAVSPHIQAQTTTETEWKSADGVEVDPMSLPASERKFLTAQVNSESIEETNMNAQIGSTKKHAEASQ